jgi:hypothetical protein
MTRAQKNYDVYNVRQKKLKNNFTLLGLLLLQIK